MNEDTKAVMVEEKKNDNNGINFFNLKNNIMYNKQGDLLITFDGKTKICETGKDCNCWTKKELIEICEIWNIKFNSNWSKKDILNTLSYFV
jgi:hypothetical protein